MEIDDFDKSSIEFISSIDDAEVAGLTAALLAIAQVSGGSHNPLLPEVMLKLHEAAQNLRSSVTPEDTDAQLELQHLRANGRTLRQRIADLEAEVDSLRAHPPSTTPGAHPPTQPPTQPAGAVSYADADNRGVFGGAVAESDDLGKDAEISALRLRVQSLEEQNSSMEGLIDHLSKETQSAQLAVERVRGAMVTLRSSHEKLRSSAGSEEGDSLFHEHVSLLRQHEELLEEYELVRQAPTRLWAAVATLEQGLQPSHNHAGIHLEAEDLGAKDAHEDRPRVKLERDAALQALRSALRALSSLHFAASAASPDFRKSFAGDLGTRLGALGEV